MGEDGGGEDPQRIKRIAAAAYDYESDPRWADYWSNILIPPHMTSRSDVADHFKRKFYQRFIDPDFVVETMSSSNPSQSASASASSSSPPVSEPARPPNRGPSSGTSAPSGRSASSLPLDRRTIHFSVNAWILVVAVLGMLPIVSRTLSNKAYRLSLLGTTCSSFYSLYTLHGVPRAWNLPSIQSWLQSIITTKDFIHFLYCLTRYLEGPCVWVEANTTTLGIMSSNAEISLGFLLIFSLFSWQRNILQTFMYWQLLKLMYHAPVSAGYHQSVWARIGRTATPYIHRYTPFLITPISAVQRWWFR